MTKQGPSAGGAGVSKLVSEQERTNKLLKEQMQALQDQNRRLERMLERIAAPERPAGAADLGPVLKALEKTNMLLDRIAKNTEDKTRRDFYRNFKSV